MSRVNPYTGRGSFERGPWHRFFAKAPHFTGLGGGRWGPIRVGWLQWAWWREETGGAGVPYIRYEADDGNGPPNVF